MVSVTGIMDLWDQRKQTVADLHDSPFANSSERLSKNLVSCMTLALLVGQFPGRWDSFQILVYITLGMIYSLH